MARLTGTRPVRTIDTMRFGQQGVLLCALAALSLGVGCGAAGQSPPEVRVPDLTRGGTLETDGVYHLGPTGARGRMFVKDFMTRHARQILVTAVDAGSPADGVLAAGDVILGIGETPFGADPRKALGRAITEAETEAAKGVLKLLRWRGGTREVVSLRLKVMGTFSATAPYDCAKSRRIEDDALRYLATRKQWSRFSLEALAFLASGKPEYVRLVREHLHGAKWAGPDAVCGVHAWTAGYHNLVLTEYYLATSDEYVLPAIREHAVKIAMGQSGTGTWGHRFALPSMNGGKLHGRLGGYGELNAAGLPCFLSLVLSKKCGVSHPEIDQAIERSSDFFGQFVDKGTIGYGYHRPSLEHNSNGRNGDSSNGKNATAAVVFSLMGKHDAARFFSRTVAASYAEREFGHSGNSFHQFWGMLGANCAGPKAAAAFARELRWYAALTRKADGSFVYQPLGGTYGRGALDATVAHALANALPLRKIYLTGKGSDPKTWLDEAEVKQTVAAGRWRWADYDAISAEKLIDELDCWSPAAREWVAEALGKKQGDFVPRLRKMLAEGGRFARAGACTALGFQGERAAPAVGDLTRALSDKESIVRVTASYALMRIGAPARRAVPDMLRAVLTTKEDEPMLPTQQAVAYSLGHKGGGVAPLYFNGMFASWPRDENPLAGLDRQLLYPAMAKLLTHPSARVRGSAAYAYRYFTPEDVGAMAQAIYDASTVLAPGYSMFGDLPRSHGLDLMARYRLAEGVPLCLDMLDPHSWGQKMRFPNRFAVLQAYGAAAKSELPRLRELRWTLKKPEDRALVEQTIKAIESDTRPAALTSLAELADKRLVRWFISAKSKKQCVSLCRKLIADSPNDTFTHAAALKQLAAMDGAGALDDLLVAAGHPDARLRATAVKLAAGLGGQDVTDTCVGHLSTARGPKLAGVLVVLGRRGEAKVLAAVSTHLKDAEPAVRLAAIGAVGELGGRKAIRTLIGLLAGAEIPSERQAAESALVVACRDTRNSAKGTKDILAALPGADESARCSLLRVLGRLGGAEALAAAGEAAGDASDEVRKTAIEVLATSPGAGATAVLIARAEQAPRGRAKSELISACLRRVITGRAGSEQRLALLDRLIVLGGRDRSSRTALDELPWSPSPASLRMALSWMHKEDKAFAGVSEHAAKVVVAIVQAMPASDKTHRKTAVDAVRDVLAVTKDAKTIEAAKAFLAQHGG